MIKKILISVIVIIGGLRVVVAKQPSKVDIKLDFAAPMESTANTTLVIAPAGKAVKVTWTMDGRNDFIGKFFGLVMGVEDMVGESYKQGLADLKKVAEQDAKP